MWKLNKKGLAASSPSWVKWAVAGVILIVVWKAYTLIKGTANLFGNVTDTLKNDAQGAAVNNAFKQYGLDSVAGNRLVQAAESIYSAFFKDSWFGLGEDETKAIDALNTCVSVQEAKALASIFRTNYNKGLYDCFNKYVHWPHTKDIKSFILDATKGV